MVFARDVARAIVVLYIIGFLTTDGKSVKKRVVSEIQLMHDWGQYLNEKTRLAWLKRKLAEVTDPNEIPGGPLEPSNNVRLQKRTDTSLVANQDHQLASGEKTLWKTNKADVDILSKVNPYLE
ncbi:parathyroid hormone [Trichosurus vulpecula]|uniref:parathyroid hormone n=1 Tax=Trichosurus vulpecula TaxID=9337 RepID=UPI00186B3EAE|nr:parathyroid hormone [Trichosurus vulpecula]